MHSSNSTLSDFVHSNTRQVEVLQVEVLQVEQYTEHTIPGKWKSYKEVKSEVKPGRGGALGYYA